MLLSLLSKHKTHQIGRVVSSYWFSLSSSLVSWTGSSRPSHRLKSWEGGGELENSDEIFPTITTD